MSFLPIDIPPGVVRLGTVYRSRGRWHSTQLVRWFEEVMRAVGGWVNLERTDDISVSAAISDDGGVFTDETADANEATADDVVLIPASPAIGDAFYIGYDFRFSDVEINTSTAATDGAVTWEYWDGTAWTALDDVVDGTVGFTVTTQKTVGWTIPTDWAKTTVNSQGPYYYVRARVTTAGTTTALGQQAFIGTGPVEVTGVPRAIHAWVDNDRAPWIAIGTTEGVWAYSGGVLTEITPAGFTAGTDKGSLSSGAYGSGVYGAGAYGVGSGGDTIEEADLWSFDNFGEVLIAVFNGASERTLYSWDLNTANDLTALSGTPPSARAVVVTPERFVVALAAAGDGRLVQWSDQQDKDTWTESSTNQAGNFPLSSAGDILAGRRGRDETLIWTTDDLWAMRFIGGDLVYSFNQVGVRCGAVSRQAMAVVDGSAIWMGQRGFFKYDGFVKPVPCAVADYVFEDLNRVQASLIWATTISEFREVWWFYPSGASTECDRYVVWNYAENFWYIGTLERTAGADLGAIIDPVMADASGRVYSHEIEGEPYLDTDETTELVPVAESGPQELGAGDRLLHIQQLIPDEKTLGDVKITLHAAPYPTAAEVEHGPFTLTNPTDIRVTARQVRLEIEQVTPGWRVGTIRYDAVPGSRR